MMKRILVTGGAGFLGSHLCEQLLRQGHKVICLDNFLTGTRENIAPLLQNPHFRLIEHDLVQFIELDVDEIYNLACPASPVHYQHDPIRTLETNFLGTMNVLKLAQKKQAKILQASTSEVYGNPTVHPQNESYWGNVNPIGIRSCYDEGKRAAECLMMDYHRHHAVRTKIARIFNTYGPRMSMHDGRVVSNFIVQALQHETITVYGNGTQTRSFCYVDDMIDGLMKLMNTADDFPGPVNLGNPQELTILQLANTILHLTGSHARIHFHPLPPDDPVQRKPDISLARGKIGWLPRTPLEEGLSKTIDYFRSVVKNSVSPSRRQSIL